MFIHVEPIRLQPNSTLQKCCLQKGSIPSELFDHIGLFTWDRPHLTKTNCYRLSVSEGRKRSSGEKHTCTESKHSELQVRVWRAVSAAGSRGGGLRERGAPFAGCRYHYRTRYAFAMFYPFSRFCKEAGQKQMPDLGREKPTLCDSAAAPGAMKRGRVGRAGGKLKMTLAAPPISNVQNHATNNKLVYNIHIQLYNQHSYTYAYICIYIYIYIHKYMPIL